MGAMAYSVTVHGVTGHLSEAAAEIAPGLPSITVSGPGEDKHDRSTDRVRAAIASSGWTWPQGRVVLTVSPPYPTPIKGVHDLALAVAVLAATGTIPVRRLAEAVLLGELAPSGRLRPVRGILPAVLAARDCGLTVVIVPQDSLAEAALAPGITVLGAEHLDAVLAWIDGADHALTVPSPVPTPPESTGVDLSQVRGHYRARWALEVAAAGGHHLRMIGPPTAGLGALAQRLPGILPPLTETESLEVAAIASLAATLPEGPLAPITTRPYVAVHHSAGVRALHGAATSGRPGALARAHLGVLHLQSYPDLHNRTIEALRSPLDEAQVVVANRDSLLRLPCDTIAVLTSGECLCYAAQDTACACPPAAKRRYQDRLRRVLAERVDITIRDNPEDRSGFGSDSRETSAEVRHRVTAARAAAAARWCEHGYTTNARVPAPALRQHFPLSRNEAAPLESALRLGRITGRGADRTLAVAATIADLRGAERPSTHDIVEALHLRGLGTP